MKPLFAFFAAFLLVAAIERPAQAAQSVPVDVFYESLSPYGDWVDVEGYGYCFRPTVTSDDPGWRPYTEGSWVYSDAGWTWESEEDFGWATYHYGRWFLIGDTWLWTPGDGVWGPAWVSWRTSDDYIGWAPLPPEAHWQPDTGFGIYVDVDYNIGPRHYCFLPVRYLGERRLRHRVEPWQRNVEYMRYSENRTRITHRSGHNHMTSIFNDGPDFNVYSRRTENPIRRLTLAANDNVNFRDRSSRLRNTEQNDRLSVIAPTIDRIKDRDLAPKTVKNRFDRGKVNRGWEGYREEEVRDLRTKMETASRDPKVGDRKMRPTDPATARTDRDAKTDDRPPRALPSDRPTASSESNQRPGARTDDNDLSKVKPVIPGRGTDERAPIRPGDKEELRKAVPVVPGDANERSRIRPDDNPKRKTPSLDPARDGKPGVPDKFRGEPQTAPPRSQTGPRPGVNRPDDNPPGPSRKIIPGEDSGNSKRPHTGNVPKMKPNGVIDDSPPKRIKPQTEVQRPVEPQAKKIEPRRIEPPKQEAPKLRPEANRPSPPQNVQRPPQGGGKPSGKPGGHKDDDDDNKKKKD